MKRSFFRRYALPILIAAVCTVPLAVIGVRGALRDMNNNFREWLPKGFQETEDYDWFLENFGSEEMAVVSWPGCTLDDDRLERMSDALKRLPIPGGSGAGSNQLLFKRIFTPRQVLDQLREERARQEKLAYQEPQTPRHHEPRP